MSLFVDTSALVKYYYPEEDSLKVEQAILGADRIYISELSTVEFASALMKKVRDRSLRDEDKSAIWDTFVSDLHAENMELVGLSEDEYLTASELILEYGKERNLRTLDSLQLAAALKAPTPNFLAADRHLMEAAELLGLQLVKM